MYDKATEKWFKLNNLNQYEEYGVYGEGRNITYYEGKLTIDEGDDGEDYSTHYLTLVAGPIVWQISKRIDQQSILLFFHVYLK